MASAVEMLVAGAALLGASYLSGERLQHWPALGGWLALGYLVVFGSLIAFSAYLYLLGRGTTGGRYQLCLRQSGGGGAAGHPVRR